MTKDLHSLLLEKLSARIPDAEHKVLLGEILDWYIEGGSKLIKARIDAKISSILQGWDESVE
ncbi:hypothetical protein GTO27_05120 [Candidatus Bathyarchaeota archaeon]|nr:hypothetical protein [Candidatus Bathyarchaeota archaeon]